ncbi:D-methionine transport system substrate-binding protein [Rhodoligotrophos appendicifer]|uniref:MetQ/NlpA family ABC transporter substrate-binding protein n=1 Tax=Rhodoligotrophos appendicifer TaxID=987056 RepID=UPI001185750B|nr:MetQ/NlpA family ABC transporter substrate-binding protein [Rhodoligotrophos appendicifer]
MSPKTLFAAIALAASLAATAHAETKTVKIGVSPGPHAEIFEKVKPLAKAKGLDLEIIEFSDYVIPNTALDAGELDANSFQNQPYLDNQNADRGFDLVSVATTVNFPLGIYSAKHKTWEDIPDGATIAIQNDPTNGGRSLLLLQDKGIIKLKPGVGFKPGPADIVENPKNLKIIEIEAAQTARSLEDVDAAAINTNYAVDAGIEPTSAILRESPKGPYVNIIVVQAKDKDAQWVKDLVAVYQTPEVKDFVETRFKGAVLPSW